MALSTYSELYKQLLLRCPSASFFPAREWLSFAFRNLWDRRLWSWQRKNGQFIANDVVNTGTVAVTLNSASVVGTGTAWDTTLVNRQFRIGLQTPIYTVLAVADATHLTLDQNWGAASTSGIGYEIYNAYFTVPSDFESFVTVIDTYMNWQLLLNVTQQELNIWDAQRANQGTTYCVVQFTYDQTVTPPLPRFEMWPHRKSQMVWPFIYVSRLPDLQDANAALPRYIRGDVLLEMALAQAARWPGPSLEERNPYFNLALAQQHDLRAERMIMDMERTDDEVYESDAWYTNMSALPMAALPLGDSRWLQSHA